MPPGPWAMSVMMQTLHPSATSGANSVMLPAGVMRAILAARRWTRCPREPAVAVRTVGDGPRLAVGRWHLGLLQRAHRGAAGAPARSMAGGSGRRILTTAGSLDYARVAT